MKRLLFSVLTIGAFGLLSCERDWDCRCSVEAFGFKTTQDATLKDMKRNQAKEDCKDAEYNLNNLPSTEASCKLKPA